MSIPFHRFADIFPLIDGPEFDAFVEDIRQKGVIEPIWILEGAILDGRNRYRACVRLLESGAPLGQGWGVWAGNPMLADTLSIDAVQHPFRRFIPSEHGDPLDFVESKNLRRRDLTTGQRAAAAAEVEQFRHGGRRVTEGQDANLRLETGEPAPAERPAETRADLAARYGVSERAITDAAKVRDEGASELKQALKQGEVVPDVAATIATLPQQEQKALLDSLVRDPATGKIKPEAKRDLRKIATELKQEKNEEKAARREQREREQGQANLALPGEGYGVIVADPEWHFKTRSENGMDRHAANHYATSPLEAIMARRAEVDRAAGKHCVLGLWCTDLANGLKVLEAWGFEYKSYFVWVKDVVDFEIDAGTRVQLKLPETRRFLQVIGTAVQGFWNGDRDEIMLLGVRGTPACPTQGTQGESVWFAARPHEEGSERNKHSAKPDTCFDWFDTHFPSYRKLEMNARRRRDGWDAWGLEAPVSAADGAAGGPGADTQDRRERASEGPAPTTQEQVPAGEGAPAIGECRGGYRFKGGDPRDHNNWEPEGGPSYETAATPPPQDEEEITDLPPFPWAGVDLEAEAAEREAESDNEAAEAGANT